MIELRDFYVAIDKLDALIEVISEPSFLEDLETKIEMYRLWGRGRLLSIRT